MTNLSPAAQAVLKAVTQRQYSCDPSDVPEATGRIRYEAAAALRAAAHQMVFDDEVLSEVYLAGYYTEKNRQGPNCQAAGLRLVLTRCGKDLLRSIADELEDVKYGTYRCNLGDKPQ
jgi:hypothetical protein